MIMIDSRIHPPSHHPPQTHNQPPPPPPHDRCLTPQEEIQAEIAALQDVKAARAKRDRKRERERLARLRVRQAYGMHHDVRGVAWALGCM